ncbi:MAG: metallophosphoesterase family protein [Candidatus Heimdallarchaeota archaeon]
MEVKFCHTADWHLDYFQYQKKERWQDFFIAANDCVNLIIKEKPLFVIHCGDLFHNFKPNPGALCQTVKILSKLKKEKIPFYVIRGNHDASKAQSQRFGGTILNLLEDLGYLIYIKDETIVVNEDITITGIGEYGKSTGLIVEEVLRNNPLNKNKFNILALHGYVQGQVSDNVYDMTGYELASIGFNYIALGHYHKPWSDKENNLYCPGSTEQTSLNDWGKPEQDGYFKKSGYYSININFENDEWLSKVERKEFAVRPKGRFKLEFQDNTPIDEIHSKADAFMKKHDKKGAIIRYDFSGRIALGKKNLINLTDLPSNKKSEALYTIITQNFSHKELPSAEHGLTSDGALTEILETSYRFKKKSVNNWIELANETVKILGQKSISSEKADEVQLIYDLIGEVSSKITVNEIKQKETPKSEKTMSSKKANLKQTKEIHEDQTKKERVENKESKTELSTKKSTKQSGLSQFISEGEK